MLKKLPKRDKNGQISLMALCQIFDEKRPWWWWWWVCMSVGWRDVPHPDAIGDVDNSKRPLLIIPKVQLRLRVTRRSATALARYPQKLAKNCLRVKISLKFWWLRRRSCVHTVNNRRHLEIATSAIALLHADMLGENLVLPAPQPIQNEGIQTLWSAPIKKLFHKLRVWFVKDLLLSGNT